MFALNWILADGVTIKLGDQVWSFGLNFIVYLVVAAIVGLVAESLVGWRLPLGIVGAIVAAFSARGYSPRCSSLRALAISPSMGCLCFAPWWVRFFWSRSGIS